MKSQTLAVTEKVTFSTIPVKTAIILHIKVSPSWTHWKGKF